MPTEALRHARLLRPFPTKRLADTLYHVIAEGHGVAQALERVLRDPPTVPEQWVMELDALDGLLRSLGARCGDALPELARMVDTADSDFSRALDAMTLVMRGMQATGAEAFSTDAAA